MFRLTTASGVSTGGVRGAAFSPDGRRIVTGHYDPVAVIWDVASGQQLRVLTGHTAPLTSAAFSPDGRRVFTAAGDLSLRAWDAETGKELLVCQYPGSYQFRLADSSSDGRSLAVSTEDSRTLVLNTLDWTLAREDIGPWKLATYKTWLQESGMATAPAGK